MSSQNSEDLASSSPPHTPVQFGPVYLHSLVVSFISALFLLAQFSNQLVVVVLVFCIIASSKITEYLIKDQNVVFGDQMKIFIDKKITEIHTQIKEKLDF